jgi:hypothetical protein
MPRPLKEIAKDVRSDWISIHPEAEPFLAAMERLDQIRADRNADVKVLAQFRWAARKWGDLLRGGLRTKSISFSKRIEPHDVGSRSSLTWRHSKIATIFCHRQSPCVGLHINPALA